MSATSDPIGLYGKLNAGVLLAITPEHKTISSAQRASGRGDKPTSAAAGFSMQPAYRTIGGVKVRLAEGGKQDGPTLLLLSPLPQSILAFDPIWTRLGEHSRLVALDLPGFGRSEGGVEFIPSWGRNRIAGRLDRDQRIAFGYAVAHLHVNRDNRAGRLGRHVHCRLVRFECYERIFYGDHVARSRHYFDDFDVGKVAEVRDRQLDGHYGIAWSNVSTSASCWPRNVVKRTACAPSMTR